MGKVTDVSSCAEFPVCLAQDGLYGRKEGLEPRKDRLYISQRKLFPVESFTLSPSSYAFDF